MISFLAAFEFAVGEIITGAVLIIISGLFDVLDGAVARAHGKLTPFGGVFDSVCDRYADAIIFAGMIYGSFNTNVYQVNFLQTPLWAWALIALIGS